MEPGERDPRTSAAAAAFDLNAALAEKRTHLAAEGLSAGKIDELEDHLRMQCAELVARGLVEEEAWWLAERRLGPPRALAREFGTLEAHLPAPIVWIVLGFALVSTSHSLLLTVAIWVLSWTGSAWSLVPLLLGSAGLFWCFARHGVAWVNRPALALAQIFAVWIGISALQQVAARYLPPGDLALETVHPFLGQVYIKLAFWSLLLLAVLTHLFSDWFRRRHLASS